MDLTQLKAQLIQDAELQRNQFVKTKKPSTKEELIPDGFTEELKAFGNQLGCDVEDEFQLNAVKAGVVAIRRTSQGELKDVRAELRVVSAPYRQRIEQIKMLIENCNRQLGIKRVKRTSKVELLTIREAELLDTIASLKGELAKLTAAVPADNENTDVEVCDVDE